MLAHTLCVTEISSTRFRVVVVVYGGRIGRKGDDHFYGGFLVSNRRGALVAPKDTLLRQACHR